MIYYPGEDGGLQMVLVPWTSSIDFRMPVAVWRETIEHYYPNTGWVAVCGRRRSSGCSELKVDRGLATSTRASRQLLDEAVVAEALDQLVDSLLYEGYALYPYTPGAAKNSTPTPFGIVYPPAYAARWRHLRPSRGCGASARGGRAPCWAPRCGSWRPTANATRRRHRRLALGAAMVDAGVSAESGAGWRDGRALGRSRSRGRAGLGPGVCDRAARRTTGRWCPAGWTAPGRSHARCCRRSNRAVTGMDASSRSARGRPCASVNTYPVLATRGRRRDGRGRHRAARSPADRPRKPRRAV